MVAASGGRVVKLDGQRVTACFSGGSPVEDARDAAVAIINLMVKLHKAVAAFPKARIALDVGAVQLIDHGDETPPEPRGEALQRCERIAGVTPVGAVLASTRLRDALVSPSEWRMLPKLPVAEFGDEHLHQLKGHGGEFKWIPAVDIAASRPENLQDKVDRLQFEVQRRDATIAALRQQLNERPTLPVADDDDPQLAELRSQLLALQSAQLAALAPLLLRAREGRDDGVMEQLEQLRRLLDELVQRRRFDVTSADAWRRLLAPGGGDGDG
jgi:hypothetical protein